MAPLEVSIFMHTVATNVLHGATLVAQCLAWPKQCLHASGNVVESRILALEKAVSCGPVQLLHGKRSNIMMCYVFRRLWRRAREVDVDS